MGTTESASDDSKEDRLATRRVRQRLLILGVVTQMLAVVAASNALWVMANIFGAVAIPMLVVGVINMLVRKNE